MRKFLIYLFTSALHVSDFLQAHLQRQVYKFSSALSLLCMVSAPIHNILSIVPQLSISQKALGTLPEDGNVMPKHVGVNIINNQLNE
jgi:hypothetical protein